MGGHRTWWLAGGVALSAGVLAAPAGAEVRLIGSGLGAPAAVAEAHGTDTAFWQAALPGGAPVRSPFDGQVRSVTIRGFAQSDWRPGTSGGETMFHIQVLRPAGGRQYQVRDPGGTSQAFFLPQSGGPDRRTTFRPTNLCVRAGDAVAFNTVGGFHPQRYPSGTPLQIFADVPGATLDVYEKANGTNNGATLTGNPREGRELLMQVEVGTGADATGLCPGGGGGAGGPAPPPPPPPPPSSTTPTRTQKVSIPRQRVRFSRRGGRTRIGLYCRRGPGRCKGLLSVVGPRRTILASAPYTIRSGGRKRVRLALSATGRRIVRRGRRVAARIVAVTEPGGAAYTTTRTVVVRRR